MDRTKQAVLGMTGICALLGVMIGIQVKTVRMQTAVSEVQRVAELSLELKKAAEENALLLDRLSESEKRLSEYETAAAGESETVEILGKELASVRALAGWTEVTGRGITVTITDSSMRAQNGGTADNNAYLVHAEDLLSIVNELFVAGAEAMSINGQRMIATSSIRCAGPVVNVNGVKIAAPFVITAIGEPKTLEAALRFPGGVMDSLSPWGIEIKIKSSEALSVPGYSQPIVWKEAVLAEEEAEK